MTRREKRKRSSQGEKKKKKKLLEENRRGETDFGIRHQRRRRKETEYLSNIREGS